MPALQTSPHPPNPFALSAILSASARYTVMASRDIVDVRGIKLWAAGKQVTPSLGERLLERKLLLPLETCLEAQDGIHTHDLEHELGQLLVQVSPLARLLHPHAAALRDQLRQLPLHSVVQLLLTAGQASRPGIVAHSVAAMALAGAMAHHDGAGATEMARAMLAGLLHDLGEIYINPNYALDQDPSNLQGFRQMAVHPRLAQMILLSTTDTPSPIARAVAEHHERLDGSGYPARLTGQEISPLGRRLSVVECSLQTLQQADPASNPEQQLAEVCFALRVVPGEYDWSLAALPFARHASSRANAAARRPGEAAPAGAEQAAQLLQQDILGLRRRAEAAQAVALNLREQTLNVRALDIAESFIQRLDRWTSAFNALGLWSPPSEALATLEWMEWQQARRELAQRLVQLQRECLLCSEGLPDADVRHLQTLWAELALH